jgi:hypothetical protein
MIFRQDDSQSVFEFVLGKSDRLAGCKRDDQQQKGSHEQANAAAANDLPPGTVI